MIVWPAHRAGYPAEWLSGKQCLAGARDTAKTPGGALAIQRPPAHQFRSEATLGMNLGVVITEGRSSGGGERFRNPGRLHVRQLPNLARISRFGSVWRIRMSTEWQSEHPGPPKPPQARTSDSDCARPVGGIPRTRGFTFSLLRQVLSILHPFVWLVNLTRALHASCRASRAQRTLEVTRTRNAAR